jgi:hypothetical protein
MTDESRKLCPPPQTATGRDLVVLNCMMVGTVDEVVG